MHENDRFLVMATDGQSKRWLWDSRWFEVPPGEMRILEAGPAQQAVRFFTTRGEFGDPICTVEVEPYSGEATLQPVTPAAFRDEDGAEYGSLAELISAVKARTASPGE